MNFLEALTLSDVSREMNHLAHELSKESVKNIPKKNHAARVKTQSRTFNTIQGEFRKSFQQYYERMKHGLNLLVQEGLFGKIDREKILPFIVRSQDPHYVGKSIQDELGIQDELMAAFYECAQRFFKNKDFISSADVFLVLTFLNASVPSFWAGLGMAEEMKHDFDAAALAFIMAAEVHGEGYSWAIKAAGCLLNAGKKEQACKLLDIVIKETSKAPKYVQEKEDAIKMKRLVE